MIKYIFIIGISFLLMGCQGTCTLEDAVGIRLTVTDFDTGGGLCGLSVMIIDGDYIEEQRSIEACDTSISGPFLFAFGRAGTYQIIISKEGYQTWEVENFVVDQDVCHVITRSLEVELVKL